MILALIAAVVVSGELKQWHAVALTFDGPASSETAAPNPFTDYRLDVTFTGPSGQVYRVPGYYAADGDAADTGATSGNKWRVTGGDWENKRASCSMAASVSVRRPSC